MELHAHSDKSNIRLRDALTKVDNLIQTASDLGLSGLAITDHECVAAHVQAIQTVREKKKINKKTGKSEIPQDFKLILGNEIYLIDDLEEARDNYQSGITKFPHFLLLAKDAEAHEALRILSSQAWENSFYTGAMERVPTTMDFLEKIVKQYPNKLIASSACLGSSSSIHILNDEYDKAQEFLQWCKDLFGRENFYLELQPSADYEQRKVNEWLINFSETLDLDLIITNDVHYLRPEDADAHEAFLNSKEGDREVKSFYSNTFLHTNQEIYDKLDYIDREIIDKAFDNTMKIGSMIEDYTIEHETIIPRIELPDFAVQHLFENGYDKYEYIKNMANSEEEQDRYLLHLIENGFLEYIPYKTMTSDKFHEVLARIDVELEQLWKLSASLKQSMSSYYVTVAKIVDIMWNDDDCDKSRAEGSLVGSGRGSAVAFLINYLMGITQVNPMEYGIEIPYWRHLAAEMSDISSLDVDVDINGSKKGYIFDRIKESFGEDRFLQVCTFGTEGSKSAIQTACRGLGIDLEEGQFISSLIPFERGENYSISDCLYGNEEEGRKSVAQFISEVEKHPRLKETALKIEGLVNKRSVHAGGVLILNNHYTKTNALMKSPNGVLTTQFNLNDSQAMGNIKYDILTIESLEKLQTAIELLLEAGEIEWQGSLRKTFNKYFHPEVIDKVSPDLFTLASSGTVPDLFQFSTQVGHNAIIKAKPENLIEMTATNSLMRLQSSGSEQPIDTFIRFKEDISLWYEEMREFNLNDDEIKIMEDHLLPLNGVADTQESVMLLAMDERVAKFDIAKATKLRKSIASKSDSVANAIKETFFEAGIGIGTRKQVLEYVWYQISRMLSYAFSSPHTLAYSLIAMIQLNMVKKYNPIYWQTAVLTVNSGSQEVEDGEKGKGTNYGKTAETIGILKSLGVKVELPLINSANFSFTPDVKNDRIIYSLKGVTGVGDEVAQEIVKNRPYSSFDDFHERIYLTKIIQKSAFLKLIKAGAFGEFGDPVEMMKQFVVKEVVAKESLNGQNLSRIIGYGMLNEPSLSIYQEMYNFRVHMSKAVHEVIKSPKDKLFILDDSSRLFFENNFSFENVTTTKKTTKVEPVVVGEHNGKLLVSEKAFKRQYDKKMLPLKDLYVDKEFVRKYNVAQFYEIWNELAVGSVESWEMEAVSFYSDRHELDVADLKRYGVTDFFSLDETPVVESEYQWRGSTRQNYKTFTIAGTVLSKDSNKHTISVLTPSGVVTCKQWGGSYSHYDRQIKSNGKVLSKSWFGKGELLLLRGYRQGDMFRLRAPKGTHTINRITEIRADGTLGLQAERPRPQ